MSLSSIDNHNIVMTDELSEPQFFGHKKTNSEVNATQISGLNQEQQLAREILNDDSAQNNAFNGKNSHNTVVPCSYATPSYAIFAAMLF